MTRRGHAQGRATVVELPVPAALKAYTFGVDDDEYVVFELPLPKIEPPRCLTRAEREVVRGVLAGSSDAEIARRRGTSPRTVANQLRAIYGKLGISGRSEMIQRCVRS